MTTLTASSRCGVRRRLVRAAASSAAVAALVFFAAPARSPQAPTAGLGRIVPLVQSSPGGGACDVTGVAVTYETSYRTTPALGYYVTGVVVHDIAWPSCNGATVEASLRSAGEATVGSGTVPVGGSLSGGNVATVVPITPQPDAAAVTQVVIELSGGTTPIPPECQSIKFDFIAVGTLGNDTIDGTNKNDLVYTLEGVDKVNGFNGTDCITGGPDAGDNATIVEGNGNTGNNVVLAGHGDNRVTVGGGDNLVKLGKGTNVVVAGNGANTVYVGTGANTITVGNGKNTIFTGGRTSTSSSGSLSGVGATVTRIGNGSAIRIYGGNGPDTIYLGTGNGTVDGGGGSNVCHVPSLKYKYSITHCSVVAP